jgi:hypothetical protein
MFNEDFKEKNQECIFQNLVNNEEVKEINSATILFSFKYINFKINDDFDFKEPIKNDKLISDENLIKNLFSSEKPIIQPAFGNKFLVLLIDKKNTKVKIYSFKMDKEWVEKFIKIAKKNSYECEQVEFENLTGINVLLYMVSLCILLCEGRQLPDIKDEKWKKICEGMKRELLETFLRLSSYKHEYLSLMRSNDKILQPWNSGFKNGRFLKGNNIEFINSADKFYKKLKEKLDAFQKKNKNKINKNTYVRLAFWDADKELKIENKSLLIDAIDKAAKIGCVVQIILWQPAWIERKYNTVRRE